jgi:ABC-type polysaccharide/polyol phosphate transport system ATPase subunit
MNAIAVQNLGKKFKLFTSPGGRFLEYMSIGRVKRHEDFWALKDISFVIPRGITLGILGQNGSGKSTLLSILAGVLYPSEGSFEINGKVSAILELGSGFHPEFSGKDNIYMYGSIMGLAKQEIDTRIDEIIRFSELGDFIDQPLRTYSSGMIVRLAFSVAVNVDADILIVDEALAVGDAIFQHRCFRKIQEMQAAGKTILYVGHDTEAVRNLCTSALLLDGGRIIEQGDPNTVVNKYYALISERERTYSEGHLIEHGEVLGEEIEVVYNFVQNLNTAKIVCPPAIPVVEQAIQVNSTPRKVIFAHPPSKITYDITLETSSSLAFAIGILPEAWEKIAQGIKYDIEVLSEGEKDTIFSRVLEPKRNVGDRGWHNFIVSLEKYTGRSISITFITSGSGDDLSYGWGAWGWAKLVSDFSQKLRESDNTNEFFKQKITNRMNYGNKKAELIKIELLDDCNCPKNIFKTGELSVIAGQILFNDDIDLNFVVGFSIYGKYGRVYGTCTLWEGIKFKKHTKGDVIYIRFSQKLFLAPGFYSIDFDIATAKYPADDIEVLHNSSSVLLFQIESQKPFAGITDLNSDIQVKE